MATGALVITRADFNFLGNEEFYYRIKSNLEPILYNHIYNKLKSHSLKSNNQIKMARSHMWTKRFDELMKYINI